MREQRPSIFELELPKNIYVNHSNYSFESRKYFFIQQISLKGSSSSKKRGLCSIQFYPVSLHLQPLFIPHPSPRTHSISPITIHQNHANTAQLARKMGAGETGSMYVLS